MCVCEWVCCVCLATKTYTRRSQVMTDSVELEIVFKWVWFVKIKRHRSGIAVLESNKYRLWSVANIWKSSQVNDRVNVLNQSNKTLPEHRRLHKRNLSLNATKSFHCFHGTAFHYVPYYISIRKFHPRRWIGCQFVKLNSLFVKTPPQSFLVKKKTTPHRNSHCGPYSGWWALSSGSFSFIHLVC